MINLKYTLENAAGSKTITIKNVKSNIDADTSAVNSFGDKLSGYLDGDYSLTGATKIVTTETEIEI